MITGSTSPKEIVWATSFNDELYEATGKNLISSFTQLGIPGTLFIGYEQTNFNTGGVWHNIGQSHTLHQWLTDNADVIPTYLGGTYQGCKCPAKRRHAPHAPNCPGYWYNRNASRWFRKMVTLQDAPECQILIWIDSDCQFIKTPTVETVDNWFRDASVFYFKSSRAISETGLFGMRGQQGKQFFDTMLNGFTSGEFRKDPRWDDSYQFDKTRRITKIPAVDLATKVGARQHVMKFSPVNEYIIHHKGSHGRVLDIMI